MWNSSIAGLPSVLIVQNKSGNVFIVDNNSGQSQVERILQQKNKTETSKKVEKKSREASPIPISQIKEEPLDYNFGDYEYDDKSTVKLSQVSFIDPNVPFEEFACKTEPDIEIEEIDEKVDLKIQPKTEPSSEATKPEFEPTFDGIWSSDDDATYINDDDDSFDSDDEPLSKLKLRVPQKRPVKTVLKEEFFDKPDQSHTRDFFWSHKKNSLAGKIACKYCESIFETRDEQVAHDCKYLKCHARNFICRVCGKELSRKTFSNHLHETLACQYCNKKFVNPRSMKTHMMRQHKVQNLVAPTTYKERREILNQQKEIENGGKRKTYPKKRVQRECDFCGKYLFSRRTMEFHMTIHMGTTSFICENCGEKFYTPTGLKRHSCEKKRRRPERDFLISFDMRYCRFCDTRFDNYGENKAHKCMYQHQENRRRCFCRICSKEMKKCVWNRHMETHTDVNWCCTVCGKKLITERALKIHMTTHTGNKQYTCTFCPESFISRAVLDRHMRFHGATPKLHRCEFCFMELSTETVLRRHIQKIHKQTAICELCKAELPSRELLKEHMMHVHEPAVCPVCNKSFALPRYLKMHEKLHFNDPSTRQTCSICSKSLAIKNIKAHVYRHHPDQFDSWLQDYTP